MTLKNCTAHQWQNPALPMPPPPEQPNQDEGGLPAWEDAEPLTTIAAVDALAVCHKCGGTGFYYWVDWITKCLFCNGTGKAK